MIHQKFLYIKTLCFSLFARDKRITFFPSVYNNKEPPDDFHEVFCEFSFFFHLIIVKYTTRFIWILIFVQNFKRWTVVRLISDKTRFFNVWSMWIILLEKEIFVEWRLHLYKKKMFVKKTWIKFIQWAKNSLHFGIIFMTKNNT